MRFNVEFHSNESCFQPVLSAAVLCQVQAAVAATVAGLVHFPNQSI